MRNSNLIYHSLATFLLLFSLNTGIQGQTQNESTTGFGVFPAHSAAGCTEIVDFPDGSFHYAVHQRTSTNGDIHAKAQFNFNLTGVGRDSGKPYRCVSAQHDVVFATSAGATETITIRQNLIGQGQGKGSVLVIKVTLNLEFDSNGMVVVFMEDASVDCPGS